MPIIFFGGMALIVRHSCFYNRSFAKFVNSKFGDQAYEAFLVDLRIELLFAITGLIDVFFSIKYSHLNLENWSDYGTIWFFLSGSLSFALMYLILYLRKVPGVYPTWELSNEEQAVKFLEPTPLNLRDSLRRYWKNLIGLTFFVPITWILNLLSSNNNELSIACFFACGAAAAWPVFTRRATYWFWIVAAGLYMLGAIFSVTLAAVIRNVFHIGLGG